MIDTVKIAHNLQAAGLSQLQAETIAQQMLEIPNWADLATKSDIAITKAELKAELNLLKLMVGGVYALLVPILLKLFLH